MSSTGRTTWGERGEPLERSPSSAGAPTGPTADPTGEGCAMANREARDWRSRGRAT